MRLRALCGSLICLLPLPALAADGWYSLYLDAVRDNPTLKVAQAGVALRREESNLAQAKILPNIALSGSSNQAGLERLTPQPRGGPKQDSLSYRSRTLSLTFRQPLYHPAAAAEMDQTERMLESAEQDAQAAGQEMIIKLVSAYCEVLFAQDQLRNAASQKRTIMLQLQAFIRGLAAGTATRTDIDEAQAKLDVLEATTLEIVDQGEESLQQLAALVGRPVTEVRRLDIARMELGLPAPHSFENWLALVEGRNAELSSLRQQLASAEAEVEKARAGHYPSVDLVASAGVSTNDNLSQLNNNGNMEYKTSSIGVQFNLPLFAGGSVDADTRKSQAKVEQLKNKLEETRRRLLTQLQKTHGEVPHHLAKMAALEKAERSGEKLVVSMQKGVQAGTRSLVDVLQAEQQMFATKRDLAEARYKYIIARIKLQSMAGLVDAQVMAGMEQWLESDTTTQVSQKAADVVVMSPGAKTPQESRGVP